MLMKFYQITFISLLMLGSMIAVSSSSWFISWIGLELNLLMMIPLIISSFNSNSTESAIKYFLVQAMASLMFITSSVMTLFYLEMNYINEMNSIFIMALMMKAGIPPFHFWFPQVIEMSYWPQTFIILTWQKISPFLLVSYVLNNSLYFYIIMSVLVGSVGGFNQNSMKKILTYSSIIHSAWMLSIIIINLNMWMKYFLIYSLINMSIIYMVYLTSINHIKKMMMKENKMIKVSFLFSVLSLGGLPPFLGFLGKFMVATNLVMSSFSWMILISLISASLVALFFYCKMVYLTMMVFNMKLIFNHKKIKKLSLASIYMIIFLNTIFPSLVLLA